jgi:hypothetical protein
MKMNSLAAVTPVLHQLQSPPINNQDPTRSFVRLSNLPTYQARPAEPL